MFNRKWKYGAVVGLLAIVVILALVINFQKNQSSLKVIFLDVGQGDAILITQGNVQMLIDGGKDGKLLLEKLGKFIPFWDRNIEEIVATHPDQDHIGGLIDVLKYYKVGAVLETKATSDSETYKAWEEAVAREGAQSIEAVKGTAMKFSDVAEAEVLYPFSPIGSSDKSSNNQYSVIIKLTVGQDSFLFTGDLPKEQELALISDKFAQDSRVLNSRVLKVAHHGSKYSTSDEFLDAVRPEEAIISVGKNNTYGHPAPETLERLLHHSAIIYRTDEMGDIMYQCKVQSEKCRVEFE